MNALSLDKGRNTEIGILLDVLLSSLDVLQDPVVRHGDADVKRTAAFAGAPLQAGLVEGVGGLVHPVADVALEKLGRLLLDGHPRQQVGDAGIDGGLGVLVKGILETRASLVGSRDGGRKEDSR